MTTNPQKTDRWPDDDFVSTEEPRTPSGRATDQLYRGSGVPPTLIRSSRTKADQASPHRSLRLPARFRHRVSLVVLDTDVASALLRRRASDSIARHLAGQVPGDHLRHRRRADEVDPGAGNAGSAQPTTPVLRTRLDKIGQKWCRTCRGAPPAPLPAITAAHTGRTPPCLCGRWACADRAPVRTLGLCGQSTLCGPGLVRTPRLCRRWACADYGAWRRGRRPSVVDLRRRGGWDAMNDPVAGDIGSDRPRLDPGVRCDVASFGGHPDHDLHRLPVRGEPRLQHGGPLQHVGSARRSTASIPRAAPTGSGGGNGIRPVTPSARNTRRARQSETAVHPAARRFVGASRRVHRLRAISPFTNRGSRARRRETGSRPASRPALSSDTSEAGAQPFDHVVAAGSFGECRPQHAPGRVGAEIHGCLEVEQDRLPVDLLPGHSAFAQLEHRFGHRLSSPGRGRTRPTAQP